MITNQDRDEAIAKMIVTKDERIVLRKLKEKSTQVVAWYAHPREVRGPFYRWFQCSEVDSKYKDNVAHPEDDCKFAAAAMNSLEPLLNTIDFLEIQLKELKAELAIARERLGPAGYKILKEVLETRELREKLAAEVKAHDELKTMIKHSISRTIPGEKDTGDVFLEILQELRAELAVARERYGPAGYKTIQEAVQLREKLAAEVEVHNKSKAAEQFRRAEAAQYLDRAEKAEEKLAACAIEKQAMRETIIQSLELDLCHKNSCPFPMRAMCSNESHKIRHQALAIPESSGHDAIEALKHLIENSPHDGEAGACLYCDMGGSGHSSKGENNHDDIKYICPVVKAKQALAALGLGDEK